MQRFVGRALIAGSCVAAAVAIVALLAGEFSDTHARVIGTALGFSVFSATGGAGDAVRRARPALGLATIAASGAALLLLVVAIWVDDSGDWQWQAWGIAGLLAVCGSHASLVLRGARDDDVSAIRALVAVSIAAAVVSTLIGSLALAEAFDDVDEIWGRIAAVILVILLLTTALPPLMRKFGGSAPAPRGERAGADAAVPSLRSVGDDLAGAADRLERLDGSGEFRAEAGRLRTLADRLRDAE